MPELKPYVVCPVERMTEGTRDLIATHGLSDKGAYLLEMVRVHALMETLFMGMMKMTAEQAYEKFSAEFCHHAAAYIASLEHQLADRREAAAPVPEKPEG